MGMSTSINVSLCGVLCVNVLCVSKFECVFAHVSVCDCVFVCACFLCVCEVM